MSFSLEQRIFPTSESCITVYVGATKRSLFLRRKPGTIQFFFSSGLKPLARVDRQIDQQIEIVA